MQRSVIARNILIIGLAFVFASFGIDKFIHPEIWIGWMPTWMDGLLGMPRETWLTAVGAFETLLAVLLLVPVRAVRQTGAILCVLHLAGILTQTGWNDIAVRDIGLLLMSLGLFALI